MGRGKVNIEKIADLKTKTICFKKRRIGLIKKAMQLSKLSECEVSLRIFWKEDGSLLEYASDANQQLNSLTPLSTGVL